MDAADDLVRGIERETRKHYSADVRIGIVLAGLCGKVSISALCLRQGIDRRRQLQSLLSGVHL